MHSDTDLAQNRGTTIWQYIFSLMTKYRPLIQN